MKNLNTWVLTLSLFLNSSLAFADQVIVLQKGQPAPWTGYLFDQTKAEKVRLLNLNLEYQTKRADLLQQQVSLLQEQQLKNVEQISKLSNKLTETKNDEFLTKGLYFVLGAVITGVVSYGVVRAIR